eukprot:6213996-Pleurochrysis_carterae.AAC.4
MSNAGAGQSFAMSSDTHFHAARLQLEQLAGSAENAKGVTLALTSSLFIGALQPPVDTAHN